MTPRLAKPEELDAVLTLIQTSFAYMEDRIDPPSSMHKLTVEVLADPACEVWVMGEPPVACCVLTPMADALYLGKLAVAEDHRASGFGRVLVEFAASRAETLGLRVVELQARVELTENHAAFKRMGFRKVGETAHPGYDRPTSITMRRELA